VARHAERQLCIQPEQELVYLSTAKTVVVIAAIVDIIDPPVRGPRLVSSARQAEDEAVALLDVIRQPLAYFIVRIEEIVMKLHVDPVMEVSALQPAERKIIVRFGAIIRSLAE
jgi:hypothetical protein